MKGKVSHRKEVPSKSAVKDQNESRIQEQPQSSSKVMPKLGASPVQGQNPENREPQVSNQKGSSAPSKSILLDCEQKDKIKSNTNVNEAQGRNINEQSRLSDNIKANDNSKRKIFIAGDSIIKDVKGWLLSRQ